MSQGRAVHRADARQIRHHLRQFGYLTAVSFGEFGHAILTESRSPFGGSREILDLYSELGKRCHDGCFAGPGGLWRRCDGAIDLGGHQLVLVHQRGDEVLLDLQRIEVTILGQGLVQLYPRLCHDRRQRVDTHLAPHVRGHLGELFPSQAISGVDIAPEVLAIFGVISGDIETTMLLDQIRHFVDLADDPATHARCVQAVVLHGATHRTRPIVHLHRSHDAFGHHRVVQLATTGLGEDVDATGYLCLQDRQIEGQNIVTNDRRLPDHLGERGHVGGDDVVITTSGAAQSHKIVWAIVSFRAIVRLGVEDNAHS